MATNQFPGAGGSFTAPGRLPGASPGRAIQGQGARYCGTADLNFAPPLLKCIFNQVISGRGIPSVFLGVNAGQAVRFGHLPEFPVVVCPAPAGFLYAMNAAEAENNTETL